MIRITHLDGRPEVRVGGTSPAADRAVGGQVSLRQVWIGGGTFAMGSVDHHPERSPVPWVAVDGSWIARAPVTNTSDAELVNETGYVTSQVR
ncbi:MAG: SUMF1/EgtB/PvdO family nonheme iron enzyme [Ilumatobacteraceae bacterium]